MGIIANNAVGWVQFQLRGGVRRQLGILALCAGLIVALLIATSAISIDLPSAMRSWMTWMMVFQTGALLILGTGAIAKSIQADVASGMIQSHRLMPVAPSEAIAGYIAGAASQSLAIAAVIFIIGIFVTIAGQVEIPRWALGNLNLLLFAIFVWLYTAMAALQRQSALVWLFLFLPSITSSSGLLEFVPGLILLLGPLQGHSIFTFRVLSGELHPELVLSFAAQAAMGAIWFAGAARKYHDPEQPALRVWLALLLLAQWLALSLLGMQFHDNLRLMWVREGIPTPELQMLTALVIAMLLAALPIGNAVKMHMDWNAGKRPRGIARRPLHPLLAALLALALLVLFSAIAGGTARSWPLLITVLVCAAHVTLITAFVAFMHRRGLKASIPLAFLLGLFWSVPYVIDKVRNEFTVGGTAPTFLRAVTPIGALSEAWSDMADAEKEFLAKNPATRPTAERILTHDQVLIGLSVQWCLSGSFVLAWALTRARKAGPISSTLPAMPTA